MTYFTRNDEEEAIPIKDAKGLCCNWCVGADLDEDEPGKERKKSVRDKKREERMEKKLEKRLEKERKDALKRAANANKKPSFFKTAFFWICGIEKQINAVDLDDEQPHEEVDTSITQNRFWAIICDINAIFAMSLAAFCFAFFNVYNE